MKYALEEDMLLKRFLLGELSSDERGEVEERLFADPEYFRLFRAAEDDLTDEYLYGDLDADERQRFETYFLTTPERRESLRIARALKQYISRNAVAPVAELADASALPDTAARADAARAPLPEKKSFFDFLRLPALRHPLGAAAVLVIAVGLWFLVRPRPLHTPIPTLQANTADTQPSPREVAQSTPEQVNHTPVIRTTPTPAGNVNGDSGKDGGGKTPKPRQTNSRVYSFLILPLGQVRDDGAGQQNEVKIPSDAGVVKLRIPLIAASGRGRYRVTLLTDAGTNIKSWTNLKPARGRTGRTVSVRVPASTLTQQKYRLELAAADGDTISTFHFKVTR